MALLFLAFWTRHTNALAAEDEYPYIDLRLSHSPFLKFWFFGDLHYRLRPGPWIKGAWRFLHASVQGAAKKAAVDEQYAPEAS